MSDQVMPEHEPDPRFPSGPWIGLWTQPGVMEWTKLHMEFADGKITGNIRDSDGPSTIVGSYSTKDGTVTLIRSYHGEHAVQHEGEAYQGGIMGRWRKRMTDTRGLWRVWPLDKDKSDPARLEIPKIEGPYFEIDDLYEDNEQKAGNEKEGNE